uniref:Uncharacterized protein n=1 Tax=viral metagenome TaxID=1070528 RepID=A0A6C0JTH2_9ZZZZ
MSLIEQMEKYITSCMELDCDRFHKPGCKALIPFPIGKFKKSEMTFDQIWGMYRHTSIVDMERYASDYALPKIVHGDNESSYKIFIRFFESLPENFELLPK